MVIAISCCCKDEILYVHASGEYTLESAKSTFNEACAYIEKYQAEKVIVDCRELAYFKKATMKTYWYVENIVKEFSKRKLYPRLAYVIGQNNKDDIQQFGENVAVNRGVKAKVFYGYDEALAWLG